MHLPALLAAVLTFVLAVGLFVSGLIADGITTNHRLLEEVLYHTRRASSTTGVRAHRTSETRATLARSSVAAPAGSR